MAVGLDKVGQLPPQTTKRERVYHSHRDLGPPSAIPMPLGVTQRVTGSQVVNRLSWSYQQLVAPDGREADGFIFFFEEGETWDPSESGIKISSEVRHWSHGVPGGFVVSYAMAAYRTTQRGEERGPKVTIGPWVGLVGGSPSAESQWYSHIVLLPAPDGVMDPITGITAGRVDFLSPIELDLDPNGHPLATLLWERAKLQWVAVDPSDPARPRYGEWTYTPPYAIKVNPAPQAVDDLRLELAKELST
jgi:hypothetical protein